MSDPDAITQALLRAGELGEVCVLATVVRTLGSAYRGIGARMLVRHDGSTIGMVSGGCLEADLAARAPDVLARAAPEVVLYDARSPDDLVWGLGLGCEGLVEVMLEPLTPDDAIALSTALSRLDADGAAVIATVYRSLGGPRLPTTGARVIIATDRPPELLGNWGDGRLVEEAVSTAREADQAPANTRGWTCSYDEGTVDIAFEVIQPPVHLILCGAGPDAAAVARLADGLGWRCTTIDHRTTGVGAPARELDGNGVPLHDTSPFGELVTYGPRTAAIVMSHRYERDREYLHALLATGVAYIGVLGPRRRTARMLAELEEQRSSPDVDTPPASNRSGRHSPVPDRVFGPAGLDIGGDDPALIAVAIVAEVAAVLNGRSGAHLRDRTAPIHDALAVPARAPS